MVFDEPESAGGTDTGPSPSRVVAAALAACTAITCEMYAERKGWDLGEVEVDVDIDYGGTASSEHRDAAGPRLDASSATACW